jgi:hypothetical protein
VDEDTQKEFKKISEIREKALQAASKKYSATSISEITKYLPLVLGLMNAAELLPPDFSRYLRISWNSALTPGFYHDNLYSHYNWYYEVSNILLLYGLSKRAVAHENLVHPDFDVSETLSKETSVLLREAAGIFEYIHANICTKFAIPLVNIQEKDHFPELFAGTYKMLSYICIAECQQIGLKMSVLTNKRLTSPDYNNKKNNTSNSQEMSPLALAKLAEGIVSNFEKALDIMEPFRLRKNNGMLGGNLQSCINLNLVKYVEVSKEIFRGISYHFIGLHYKKEFDYAKQIAYLEQSKISLASINYSTSPLQDGKDIIEALEKEMKPVLEIATQVHALSATDNTYLFQHSPEKVEVVPTEGKILVVPIVFTLPVPLKIEIKQRNSLWCCIQ